MHLIVNKLNKEFKSETKNEQSIKNIFDDIKEIKYNFAQSPIYAFDEKLLEKFLKDYAKIVSFNFGKSEMFQLENKIFFDDDEYDDNLTIDSTNKKMKLSNENCFQKNMIAKMINLQQRAENHSEQKMKEFLNKEEDLLFEKNIQINNNKDPFLNIGNIQHNTICLLGNNNKALYFSFPEKKPEIITVSFKFEKNEDNKIQILKNFAACAIFDNNKIFYCGGGPSNESYILEFNSKQEIFVKTLPKLTHARCWHSVIYLRPYAYVIGNYI